MLGLLDKIHHATLSGIPLMLVMLACFLVGALCARLAIELDARALWAAIRRKESEPEKGTPEPSRSEEA